MVNPVLEDHFLRGPNMSQDFVLICPSTDTTISRGICNFKRILVLIVFYNSKEFKSFNSNLRGCL